MQMNNFVPIVEANQANWFALFYKVNIGTYINLLLFIVIMFLCFYIAKFFIEKSPYSAPFHTAKVKERIYLGPQVSMVVVELQGVQYVVVTDKNGTTFIDKRSDLVYEPTELDNHTKVDFDAMLKKYMKKNNG